MSIMIQEEYLKHGGCRCPVCGSDNINGFAVDIFSGAAEQECVCVNCGADWTDHYTLSAYSLGSYDPDQVTTS